MNPALLSRTPVQEQVSDGTRFFVLLDPRRESLLGHRVRDESPDRMVEASWMPMYVDASGLRVSNAMPLWPTTSRDMD